MDRENLEKLLEEAKARVAALSPEEYQDMLEAQRRSFVRAMTTPCEHGVLDFETCPRCRGWET
jgi:Zn-finger nucleic acid-binding protein